MTRARELGIPFAGAPGTWNAITDVPGVEVGQTTLIDGEGQLEMGRGPVRTGVTAILPQGKRYAPVFAGWYSFNGCGEMTGTAWLEESGFLDSGIALTGTGSIGRVYDAERAWSVVRFTRAAGGFWYLPVVGETYDGLLNDVGGDHIREEHVFAAFDGAQSGPVAEGNTGGGTGMVAHEFKGGTGTASRLVSTDSGRYTVGVLVQANHGAREGLTIAGVPAGREIEDLMPEIHSPFPGVTGSSILAVAATDAPLLPTQLKRIARRLPLGIGRTGGVGGNTSGDLMLAFSTANAGAFRREGLARAEFLPNGEMDVLFEAAIQATEEAIVNALTAAETMVGINGNTVYALPHDRLVEVLRKYNRLAQSPA